jgi:hypothetical protein
MDFDKALDIFQDELNLRHEKAYKVYKKKLSAKNPDFYAASQKCGEMAAIQRTVEMLKMVLNEWGFIDEEDWGQVIDAYEGDEYSLVVWSRLNSALPKAPGAFQAMISKIKEDFETGIESALFVMQAFEALKEEFDDVEIGPLREGMVNFIEFLDQTSRMNPGDYLQTISIDTTRRVVKSALTE